MTPRGAHAVEVMAQAKVNLRLKILAREASGFHQLETLFLRLDLSDRVRVRRTTGARSLDVGGDVDLAQIGSAENNLAWRAADAYLQAAGGSGGFAIEIEKRIPIGGGLGGGSADAGAVLRALDAMSESPLGDVALMSMAARLGADVPFLTGHSAYVLAWGRGERMVALPAPERRAVLLVLPQVAVNTAAAYGWLADARAAAGTESGCAVFATDISQLSDWDSLAALAENDFEPVVALRHSEVGRIAGSLRASGAFSVAMMSGSGSAVFAVERSAAGEFSISMKAKDPAVTPPRQLRTFTATSVEQISVIE